jgi:3-vinyl bacteriochlorophyllide hydratase
MERVRSMPSSGIRPVVRQLYTAEELRRRDASRWTRVQGVLAPIQFLVCLASATLVIRFLVTGHGLGVASASVVVKTGVLYLIMVTGALWEYDVYGRYLFAPAFFWEDAVSMVVIALHTTYLIGLFTGVIPTRALFSIALAAYAAYVINAAQFLSKLRAARRSMHNLRHVTRDGRGVVVPA